jgi:acetyl-CoA acetyltransferase
MTASEVRHQVVAVGAAYSDIVRRSERTVGQLAAQAARRAIEQTGIEVGDIDGLANFPSPSRPGAGALDGVDIVSPVYLAQALGLTDVRWHTSLTRGSFTGSVAEAANAVRAGACNYALVWRGMRNPPGKYGRVPPGPASRDDAFTLPYGFGNEVVKASMIYSRYMSKYGTTRDQMSTFVVANRAKAAANPDAVFYRTPMSAAEYHDARMIADPLSLLDCDMAVDGCAAIVLTTADRARDVRLPPVELRSALNLGISRSRRSFYTLEDFEEGAARIARLCLDDARMSATEFGHLEFYDGFVYFPWLWMEAFGLAAPGEAAHHMSDEQSGPHGRRPLNTGGGSLGMGRIHGGAQVVEAIKQLQGVCGPRQIHDPGPTVVTSGSPLTGCGCLVFTPMAA